VKKNAMSAHFLKTQLTALRCPVCQTPFVQVADNTLICQNKHSFDIAKKGSVFFLNAPVPTEYSAEMLVKRQHVIQAGLFTPVLNRIATLLQGSAVIDAGCGEGSQIKAIAAQHVGHYFAFDISKPAINLAVSGTDFRADTAFFVADLAHMPFASNYFSDVVNILSPSNYQEFKRVLKPQGQIIKVMPNAGYLQELRHLVYPSGAKATYDPQPVQDHFKANFPGATFETLQYDFPLTPTLAADLFAMTPLTWQVAPERFDITKLTTITVDLSIASVTI
jgi:23S rRNA (guanine745-N1)-methyltransferase